VSGVGGIGAASAALAGIAPLIRVNISMALLIGGRSSQDVTVKILVGPHI